MLAQNDFTLLVNAYYQAEALTKDFKIQPELAHFRQSLMQTSQMLGEAVIEGDKQRKSGLLDKSLISAKLKEIYKVDDSFISEIENSFSKYSAQNDNIMSYRTVFQMASDTLHDLGADVIRNMGSHVPLHVGVYELVDGILNQDFWQGDEVIRQIELVRTFKNTLHFSETWVGGYAYRMFLREMRSE